jgi:transposase
MGRKKSILIFLPKYSPHLNLIEILWRKMKQELLHPRDYESVKALEDAIFNIIRKYGDEYCINFL